MASSPEGKVCANCGRQYKAESDFMHKTSQWRQCTMGNLWFNCDCGSTLMIRKGKFEWYSPGETMSSGAASLFNDMANQKELPHIPTAVMNLQTMLKDPESEVRDIVKEVKTDPFLATEILKIADGIKNLRNPAAPPIESLEHAISYAGRKAVADLVLAISIKGFTIETERFDIDAFWDDSFLRAAITESLVTKYKLPVPKDEAYLAGCLANIGKIISAIYNPEDTDKIYDTVQNLKTMTNWNIAENRYPRSNHQILGEVGCAFWGLPDFIMSTARYHHRKPTAGKKFKNKSNLIEVVALANIITHWIQLEPAQVEEELLEALLPGFDLDMKQFEELVSELSGLKDTVPQFSKKAS